MDKNGIKVQAEFHISFCALELSVLTLSLSQLVVSFSTCHAIIQNTLHSN